MDKKLSLIFAFLIIGIMFVVPVLAEMNDMGTEDMGESSYPDFIWGSKPIMYFIDILIIVLGVVAVYLGTQMLAGELKGAFIYVFTGVIIIAFGYLLDAFSMIINNMVLMTFIHHNIIWILNAVAFILITFGFYKMNKLFKGVASEGGD